MEDWYDYEYEEVSERSSRNWESFKLAGAYLTGLFVANEYCGLSVREIFKGVYELLR